jgi:hypothetical protein
MGVTFQSHLKTIRKLKLKKYEKFQSELESDLSFKILTWLEDLVLELGDHGGDEGGVGIGEEGNRRHQRSAVVVDHILHVYRCFTVLPTGRNFGRKTQKWPPKNISGRKNQRPNFWQIFRKMTELF